MIALYPVWLLDKAGDQVQLSGAQNLVDKTDTQTSHPKQPDKCQDKGGGGTAGDGSPKERKLIEPGVKEDFLEEVVIEVRTSKCEEGFQWSNG